MWSDDDLQHRFDADSVGRALALVGERWSLLILREAFFGVRRYGEFARIVTLMRWGDTYLAGPEGPPILLRHKDCGEIADTYVACRNCGGDVTVDRVTPEPGPAFRD